MKWFLSAQQIIQLWDSLPGDAMVQMLKWFRGRLEHDMSQIASVVIGHSIPFLAQDNRETEIPGVQQSAVVGWRVCYCMLSSLISSSLGISNWACQRYGTRLHGALSWHKTDSLIPQETNRWGACHNEPKEMSFLSKYSEIEEERLTLWNRRKNSLIWGMVRPFCYIQC